MARRFPEDAPVYLTQREVANLLRCSVQQVSHLVADGSLPSWFMIRKKYPGKNCIDFRRFDRNAVLEAIEALKRSGVEETRKRGARHAATREKLSTERGRIKRRGAKRKAA